MLISQEMTYFHGSNPVALRENDEVADSLPGNGIPPRYRNSMGGVNLEQVRRDQRRARQEVVRAMIQRLGKLRHPR
ncbi:hypothetical protein MARLIPOL_15844 [Marinobacter lipolyticus SM19]|uniref:Uncharacterized protein n=1 Tax=Marinobacter lipolyticus SM19 TaxID=1318628 RepID=R8AX13_9GAMM|nr:hypothetical protein MARLIPOL_15844 [Marinobacter lipolyticus SM19]